MPAITDPNEPYFKDGIWGWIGSVWHKLAMVWGYSDRYLERVTDTAAAANGATLTFSLVPAGEVWVIEHFSTYSVQNAAGPIYLQILEAGVIREITIRPTLTAYTTLAIPHRLVLKHNDRLRVIYLNVILNQVTIAVANGYKMLIAE